MGAAELIDRAQRTSDVDTLIDLGCDLFDQNDLGAAEYCFRRASAGDEQAAAVQACWMWCESHDPSLEPALRAGANLFPSPRADRGSLLIETGRVEEGRLVLVRGTELGEVESMLPLGNLYAGVLGGDTAAEAANRAAADVGDAFAHHNLALLLLRHGDDDGAERHLRLAVEGGDTLAAQVLRELLDD